MIRKLYLISIFGLFLASNVSSQCVLPNGGFESWVADVVNRPIPPPLNYDRPEDWFPITGILNVFQNSDNDVNVFQSNEAFAGSFAVKLEPDIQNEVADLRTIFACNMRPVDLQGAYKHTGVVNDTLRIVVTLFRLDLGIVTVGTGVQELVPTGAYSNFTIPINYVDPAVPDSASIYLYYNNQNFSTSAGFIDELAWGGPIGIVNTGNPTFHIYPNPSIDLITIRPGIQAQYVLNILDLSGRNIYSGNFNDKTFQLDTKSFLPGIYLVQLNNTQTSYFSFFSRID